MDQDIKNNEIDLKKFFEILSRRKGVFIGIMLLSLLIALGNIQFAPKIYRTEMMIQPPSYGQSMTGEHDIVSSKQLKGFIESKAFNEKLSQLLTVNLDLINLQFDIEIPESTNILVLGVNLVKEKKDLGPNVLEWLVKAIAQRYDRVIAARIDQINQEIAYNNQTKEQFIEKDNELKDYIEELENRKAAKIKEIEFLTKNATTMLSNVEKSFNSKREENLSKGNLEDFYLVSIVQSNLSYLNLVNEQRSDLSLRINELNHQREEIKRHIVDLALKNNELATSKSFITNVKIVSNPKLSDNSISPNKKKVLVLFLTMGLFLAIFIVFFLELGKLKT